jgi:anti-sigma B factor antagonist
VAVRYERDGDLLRVEGEVDYATVDDFRTELYALIEAADPDGRLDLSGVEFLDTPALAVMVAADQDAARHDKVLCIEAASPQVERLLQLTALDTLFQTSW